MSCGCGKKAVQSVSQTQQQIVRTSVSASAEQTEDKSGSKQAK